MKGADRISDLHDSILSHILSFCPTSEAVATSVLSTRWRYIFASLPNIDYNLHTEVRRRNLKYWQRDKDVESFRSFIDRMLVSTNTTRIDKFCLKGRINVDSNRFHEWISAAVRLGVKQLDFNIIPDVSPTLPRVMFTCRTLTTLKLDTSPFICTLYIPKRTHCPNLKTLHLKFVQFPDDDSVKSLFSGCCSLEDVILDDCRLYNISNFNISHHLLKSLTMLSPCYSSHCCLMIDTPNLAYFHYSGRVIAGYLLENLYSLIKADIDIGIIDDHLQADATALFRGICNVRSLNLGADSLKLLLRCDPLPVFATMVELKIYNSTSCLPELETFLSNSPELEQLDFPEEFLSSQPEKVPFCMLFKLKVIEISNFRYNHNCIKKAEYILNNGGALRKLTLRTTPNSSLLSEERKLKMFKKLLGSPRKSKRCCINIV